MRRLLLIAGAVIGVAILIVAAVVGYAFFNLNSIIAANREGLLDRATAAIGRPLEVGEIKASLGWGVAIDLTGVRLADDAAYSQLPFVQADDVFLQGRTPAAAAQEIKVTELVLHRPQIRIIRSASGAINVSTLAKKGRRRPGIATGAGVAVRRGFGRTRPPATARAAVDLHIIETFTIEDGRISTSITRPAARRRRSMRST